MDLRARVAAALRRLGIDDTDAVGVACSGGADSIGLVHLLARRGHVAVLHVDHQVRPGSREDAAFVRDTASRLGLRYAQRRVDVDPHADSFEAAARDVRYAALEDMARETHSRYVLTAHTRDDQAETVLLRLMRGGSLASIAPVRGIFVRPLLDIGRIELRDWLVSEGIAWREDPTNDDPRFERNWVRHVLMPQLQERRPGVAKTIARTAAKSRADELALDAIAQVVLQESLSDDVGVFVPGVDALEPAIEARVVRSVCRRLGVDPSDHDVDTIAALQSHHRCGAVDVWRFDDGLAFLREPTPVPAPVALPRAGEITSEEWGIRVRTRTGEPFEIRTRRPGDRIASDAGTRKVQDVLVDAKVPRPLRPLVPILADGRGAVAVLGGASHASCTVAGSPGVSPGMIDVEPYRQSWSRKRAWISR
jgi:tRNA(Ile)-lysidine synthase